MERGGATQGEETEDSEVTEKLRAGQTSFNAYPDWEQTKTVWTLISPSLLIHPSCQLCKALQHNSIAGGSAVLKTCQIVAFTKPTLLHQAA